MAQKRSGPASSRCRMRIGLLGGSFNPAHPGHVHISLEALRRLKLHQVWWLVSPQNPLKSQDEMAPLSERVAGAEAITEVHPHIQVTTLESVFGTRYSIDTIKRLKRAFPLMEFVWIMGADNLAQFPRWRRWREIFKSVPLAVFDRSPFTYRALLGKAALSFNRSRVDHDDARYLPESKVPAWSYIPIIPSPYSSTELRRQKNTPPFVKK